MDKANKKNIGVSPKLVVKDIRIAFATLIEQTLDSFGVIARVVEINNRSKDIEFCLEIAMGTSIEAIVNLHKDIALALASPTGDVEIEAPIPGRALVAIRLPLDENWLKQQLAESTIKIMPKVTTEVKSKPITWKEFIVGVLLLISNGFRKLAIFIQAK
jgi:hypothetical protein